MDFGATATVGHLMLGSMIGAGASILGPMLFSDKPTAPTPPPATQPTTMPTPDDEATRAAKKKSLAAQAQRRGRQSTILSDPLEGGDILGG